MDKEQKLTQLRERENRWTDKSMSQLSLSIQIIFTITVATLGYILSNRSAFNNLCWPFLTDCEFSAVSTTKIVLYVLSAVSIIASIVFGLISLCSRNQDLRITRHIVQTRKKYLMCSNMHKELEDVTIDASVKYGVFESCFCDFTHFSKSHFCNPSFLKDFAKLRQKARQLDKYIWRFHNYQIFAFISSLILYTLSSIIPTV